MSAAAGSSGRRGLRAALAALCAAAATAGAARAQIPYLDPLPWQAAADSTSRLALAVEAGHFFDPRYDWSLDRILLTVILPGGQSGAFFVRMPHMTFDAGAEPAAGRWPAILGPETDPSWPGAGRVTSFGQPEVGATGPLKLPALGALSYGLALGLPVGVDRLYPFSSTSLPLRVEARKTAALGGRLHLSLDAGYLASMDSGKDDLDPGAFPGGSRLGAGLHWLRGRGSRLVATADMHERQGRSSLLAGLQWWFPWTADGSCGLQVAKELAGWEDRPASWFVTATWRFDSPRYRPGVAPPARTGSGRRPPGTAATEPAPGQGSD